MEHYFQRNDFRLLYLNRLKVVWLLYVLTSIPAIEKDLPCFIRHCVRSYFRFYELHLVYWTSAEKLFPREKNEYCNHGRMPYKQKTQDYCGFFSTCRCLGAIKILLRSLFFYGRLKLFQNVYGQSIKKIKDLEMTLLKSTKIWNHVLLSMDFQSVCSSALIKHFRGCHIFLSWA